MVKQLSCSHDTVIVQPWVPRNVITKEAYFPAMVKSVEDESWCPSVSHNQAVFRPGVEKLTLHAVIFDQDIFIDHEPIVVARRYVTFSIDSCIHIFEVSAPEGEARAARFGLLFTKFPVLVVVDLELCLFGLFISFSSSNQTFS